MATSSSPMRHRLALEVRSETPDGGGGWQETWVNLGMLWANINSASGSEVYQSARQSQRVTHRITLRCTPYGSVTRPRANQRFRIGNVIFAIRAVFDKDGRGKNLTCLCEEGEPA